MTGTSAAALSSTAERSEPGPNRLGTPVAAGFLGLPADAVDAWLGSPAFRRLDPPAEFRRYRIGACTLELILYPHPQKTARVVAHARYRPIASGSLTDGECDVLER